MLRKELDKIPFRQRTTDVIEKIRKNLDLKIEKENKLKEEKKRLKVSKKSNLENLKLELEKELNKELEKRISDSAKHISHENHIEAYTAKADKLIKKIGEKNPECNIHDDKSSLTKKEREKGFRAERIWIEGNSEISNESVKSNNLRNDSQF